MELIQQYLGIWQPIPQTNKENYRHFGYEMATISNGQQTIQFGYKDLQVERRSHVAPIYNGAIDFPMMMTPKTSDRHIQMTILYDNNDLYHMLKVYDTHFQLQTEQFRADVFLESVNYLFADIPIQDAVEADARFVVITCDAW